MGDTFPVNPEDGRIFVKTDETGTDGTWIVTTITEDTTLTSANTYIECDTTLQAITVTFPDVASNPGRRYIVKNIGTTGNAVTVVGTGTDTVERSATAELAAQDESVGFIGVSVRSNWSVFMAYQPFPIDTLRAILDMIRVSTVELQKLTVQAAAITDLPDVTGNELE